MLILPTYKRGLDVKRRESLDIYAVVFAASDIIVLAAVAVC